MCTKSGNGSLNRDLGYGLWGSINTSGSSKFVLQADRVFQSLGARVILTPLMRPGQMRMPSAGSGAAVENAWTGC